MKKQHVVLISGVFLVLLFVLGVYLYRSQQAKKLDFMARENASIFVREYSQTLGSDDAKVYLIKFSDPACETCSAFHPFVKKLMAVNPGKIKLVIRYAPFHVPIISLKYWKPRKIRENTGRHWISCTEPSATGQVITIHSLN